MNDPTGPALDFTDGAYTLIIDYSVLERSAELIVQDGLGINQFRDTVRFDQSLAANGHFGVASWSAMGPNELDDFLVLTYRPVETLGTLLELEASELMVDEGVGAATLLVRRTGEGVGSVSVHYDVSEETAWEGLDFSPSSGTLFWDDGDTSSKSFSVPILEDHLIEIEETLTVKLSEPAGDDARLGIPSELRLRIRDNETRPQSCTAGEHRLCLNDRRFAVEVEWRDPQGGAGPCHAVALTEDSGYCWFFDSENVELVVKVLNACAPPFDHYWVFAAGLTNVQLGLTVLDTATGDLLRYDNPQGRAFQPIQDISAFDTCPLL